MSGIRGGDKLGDMLLDETSVEPVRGEIGMPQQVLQKSDIGRDALDPELAERAIGSRHGRGEVRRRRVRDELGQQRIEIRVGRVTGVGERVDSHAGPRRRLERGQRPARRFGDAVGAHRLHVDPHLDREAARLRNVGLTRAELGERASARQLQLEFDQVDAGHFLGHRMLDLEARVGLDEGELGVVVPRIGVEQELEGAEAVVPDRFGHLHGRGGEPGAHTLRQAGAGRDFDQLLIAPLDGAFALPQMADAAGAVASDLDLEVARTRHQPLNVYVGVAEGGPRFGLASPVRLVQFVGMVHRAHPAAATAGDRLDHHRNLGLGAAVAQRREKFPGLAKTGRTRSAGQQWHPDALCQRSRAHLVAEQLEDFRPRADELDPFFGRAAGEPGVLAEEAVAGMDSVASGRFRDRHDLFDVEIGGGAGAAERAGLVGVAGME